MKEQILLVEDNSIIALYEKMELEGYGYRIETVSTGKEAVNRINENSKFNLVLMDLDLGSGIDGTETAKEILKDFDLPIIFLSNHTEKDIVSKTESISSYGYVTKNSGPIVLDTSIKMALKLYYARKEIEMELNERKKAEKKLSENEEKYHSLFMSMGQGFYISEILYDDNGEPTDYRYIDVNPAFEGIVGLPRDQIIGKTYNDLVPPDPASGWPECFKRVAKTGTPENYTFESAVYNTYFETYAFIPKQGYFAVLVKDVSKYVNAEKSIKKLLDEKELLLEEIHHRMKNNMTIIQSLLTLQANTQSNEEAKKVLKDAANRINSMKILYETLYVTKNISSLPLNVFLPALINENIMAFPLDIDISFTHDIDDFKLDTKTLSALSIIINELVTNMLKFAFKEKDSGVISLYVKRIDDRTILTMSDDGIGMPKEIDFANSPGFGMKLVNALIKQLDGEIKIHSNNGTTFIITIPVK